jgi:hypothetical protein
VIYTQDFFNSYWLALERRGWDAVILHSWQNLPDVIDSDVDYAVRGPTSRELLCFLSQFAKSVGWRLVQAIEHEPKAIFCVCQQAEPPFESIQLDVAWLYRREGHILLSSELIFEKTYAAPGKSFCVMSEGSEFAYLLAKAAAKGKNFDRVKPRLVELLSSNPKSCVHVASRAFGNVPEVGSDIRAWEIWFSRAECFESVRSGRKLGLSELLMYGRRIIAPTGHSITVGKNLDSSSLSRLVEILAPSFRGHGLSKSQDFFQRLKNAWMLVRSRLVIVFSEKENSHADVDALANKAILAMANKIEQRFCMKKNGWTDDQ